MFFFGVHYASLTIVNYLISFDDTSSSGALVSNVSHKCCHVYERKKTKTIGSNGSFAVFRTNLSLNVNYYFYESKRISLGCAHPSFPGVFSRISYYSEWSIATICQLSSEPPIEYDCANVTAPSEENSVPITVIIQFDDHPGEISWSIGQTESESVLVNVTEEIDTAAQSRSQETVFLPPGSNLTFTIRDRYGDGLCCNTPVSTNGKERREGSTISMFFMKCLSGSH